MKLVVDENIPGVDALFGGYFDEIVRLNGRTMSAEALANCDALVVRSVTAVDRKLLSGHLPKFVGTCTIGTDHLDIPFLTQSAVPWSSAPGCNADSVADYVMAALAALEQPLRGQTAAVVGCGNVGSRVALRLQSLGATVVAVDPNLTHAVVPLTSLSEALQIADICCFHTPLVRDGRYPSVGLLNEANIQLLKKGAVIVNAGRGPVIRDAALFAREDIRWVLDVWDAEPAVSQASIARAEIATPHIAGYANEAKLRGTWMIFNAWAALNDIPTVGWEQVAGAKLARPTESKAWQDQIAASYDIWRDDGIFRTALRGAPEENAVTFDGLRKHYPGRNEFSRFDWE
ncbi:4-phosphoerythronate dehydrogenase [Umboniibacter marinipuniceus]|uniref:Erythronate-4-phosphate dehydrogenase n=1 Tax=Umboniibacter marinipuniceus TaxID=569599 RepID=A0A3M0A181_9GAMM|nr:4-phosphoerythronate dehydrogenase [Umboniibacter marinipuniceus]RMA78713.1 4-phosphoerythronate dehydrogenase [Umboniibacter marinipuniceus]